MPKSKNIKIRRAKENDYETVNSLYHVSYDSYHKNLPEVYKPIPKTCITRGDFLNILESKDDRMFIAELDNKIAGLLYTFVDDYKESGYTKGYHRLEIAEISVFPKCSHLGVGTMLIKEAERWAAEKKITDLSVLVYNFNKNAIKFYEANGYAPYSIKMEKKIRV